MVNCSVILKAHVYKCIVKVCSSFHKTNTPVPETAKGYMQKQNKLYID